MRSTFAALFIVLATAALPLAGEDKPVGGLAIWAFGDGTLDGRAVPIGRVIYTGQMITASSRSPVRIELAGFKSARLILGAGGRMFLSVEPGAKPDSRRLVANLEHGALQVDGEGFETYDSLHVRGAAADVRMTGTLFVVERVQRDADFVALVKGKLKVGLRRAVAEALNKNEELDLGPRQGVVVGVNGFGAVTALNNRPVVPATAAAAAAASVQDKTLGAPEGDGGWDKDVALEGTLPGVISPSDSSGNIVQDQIVNAQNPGSPSGSPDSVDQERTATETAGGPDGAGGAGASVIDQIAGEIGGTGDGRTGAGAGSGSASPGLEIEEITRQILGELAGPPPPPGQ